MQKIISFAVPAAFAAVVFAIASFASAQMCTMDAMQCPDGSWVGRSGPNCEFVCPGGAVDDGAVGETPDPCMPNAYGEVSRNCFNPGAAGASADDTVTVTPAPDGCGENGMLCPEFIGGSGGGNVGDDGSGGGYEFDDSGCGEDGRLCPNVIGGSSDGSNYWYDDSGCGENGMLCPNYNGGGTDPCLYTNWIWINPCDDTNPPYPTYGDDGLWGWGQTPDPCAPNAYGEVSRNCLNGGDDNGMTACTADAMQCPDGSWVGRSGPNCQFVCPGTSDDNSNGNGMTVNADGSINVQGGAMETSVRQSFWGQFLSFFGW
ncbi:hypothetical protein C4568_04800 [Candidatus Parcubacteria bacterium]|nr:MAG: hypothetical protein C4568_04800 [Candidatus Parcubacteria bacterium]